MRSIPWEVSERKWYHEPFILASSFSSSVYDCQWILIALSLYHVTFSCWSTANAELLKRAIEQGQLDDGQCLFLTQEKQTLNRMKIRFNQCFQHIPLLLMSSLFVQTTGMILSIMHRGMSSNNNLLMTIQYVFHSSLVLLTVSFVCAQRRQERDDIEDLFSGWWKKSIGIRNTELKESFKEVFKRNISLSAILFDFDEKLVLGYGASLISFTVMFLQLSEHQPEACTC
ncbi:hypothetical protein HDE_03580 [Halotydeus destructor]|nr:hypothetical protein HDE_03580 [Halotydeus destructor]